MYTRNRIHLKGAGRQEEGRTASAITPGMLIEIIANLVVRAHSSEGGVAERAFALESALEGRSIADNYVDGELVTYLLAYPGDVVQAWLAAGEDVDAGDQLISAGDGTLKSIDSASSAVVDTHVVAVAEEALDLSGSGAVNTRIAVRVL